MLTFAILNGLMGAALGTRFKVGVIFPAMILSTLIMVVFSIWVGHSLLQTSIVFLVGATSLQFGYMLNVIDPFSQPVAEEAAPSTVKADEVATAFAHLDDFIADLVTLTSAVGQHDEGKDETARRRNA
jgi:putative Ca2+/H+ antiporter (TMEM165/GDT1 family)